MPRVSRFQEDCNFKTDIDELAEHVRMAKWAKDVKAFFILVSLIKEGFWQIEGRVIDEAFFLNFIRQCERSDLLFVTLCEEYSRAKIRYRWLKILNQ